MNIGKFLGITSEATLSTFLDIVYISAGFVILYLAWRAVTFQIEDRRTETSNNKNLKWMSMVYAPMLIAMVMFFFEWLPNELQNMPYLITGNYPHFYGTVGKEPDGKWYIESSDEKFKDAEGEVYPLKLKDAELEVGEYVEVAYLPCKHRLYVVATGEEAKYNYENYSKENSYLCVKKEVSLYGIIWGIILMAASGGWSYWEIRKIREKYKETQRKEKICLHKDIEKLSLVLKIVPLLGTAIIVFLTWSLGIKEEKMVPWMIGALYLWTFGVLLAAYPYNTQLTVKERYLQIGVSEYFRKQYLKTTIESIDYKNSKIVIKIKTGKKIRGKVTEEEYAFLKENLLQIDKSKEKDIERRKYKIHKVQTREKVEKCQRIWIKLNTRKFVKIGWSGMGLSTVVFWTLLMVDGWDVKWLLIAWVIAMGGWVGYGIKMRKCREEISQYFCQLVYVLDYDKKSHRITYLYLDEKEGQRKEVRCMRIYGKIKAETYAAFIKAEGKDGTQEFICKNEFMEEPVEPLKE